MTNTKPKDGAFVIIPFNKDFVWAVHHNYEPKFISLPGGGVEVNQDFATAGIEEAKQETSFDVTLIKKIVTFKSRMHRTKTVLWLGEAKNQQATLTRTYDEKEISHLTVIPVDAPLHIPLFRASRLFLKVYSLFLSETIQDHIEEMFSPPFNNSHLQQWANETKLYEEKP